MLKPSFFTIVNESHKHVGHKGVSNQSPNAETHFKLDIVSSEFDGKNLVARHRLVYGLLDDEFKQGLHALALKTKTPQEMEKK